MVPVSQGVQTLFSHELVSPFSWMVASGMAAAVVVAFLQRTGRFG